MDTFENDILAVHRMNIQTIVTIAIIILVAITLIIFFVTAFNKSTGMEQDFTVKPDGNLYLTFKNGTKYEKYIGHQGVMDFCRFEYKREQFIQGGYNWTCDEIFYGCGAMECECDETTTGPPLIRR